MNYPTGATILKEGTTGECAYIIDKGLVEISVFRDGKKVVLAILSDGEIFGEMALISGDVRSANATALVPTSVSIICRPYVEEKLSQSDPIIAMMMKLLLARFHEARSKLLSLLCLSGVDEATRWNIVGDKEEQEATIAVRTRDGIVHGGMQPSTFLSIIEKERALKSLTSLLSKQERNSSDTPPSSGI